MNSRYQNRAIIFFRKVAVREHELSSQTHLDLDFFSYKAEVDSLIFVISISREATGRKE